MFDKKAQGTIEYLVIIAIVVVIALVVVGLLLQVMDQGSGIPEQTAKTAWKSSEPWALVDWTVSSGGVMTVVLKNNSYETMGFNSFTNGTDTNNTASTVPAGSTVNKTFTYTDAPGTGEKYSITKAGIVIDYNSGTINNKTQYGAADLVGTQG